LKEDSQASNPKIDERAIRSASRAHDFILDSINKNIERYKSNG
jgi:hypothetical protein